MPHWLDLALWIPGDASLRSLWPYYVGSVPSSGLTGSMSDLTDLVYRNFWVAALTVGRWSKMFPYLTLCLFFFFLNKLQFKACGRFFLPPIIQRVKCFFAFGWGSVCKAKIQALKKVAMCNCLQQIINFLLSTFSLSQTSCSWDHYLRNYSASINIPFTSLKSFSTLQNSDFSEQTQAVPPGLVNLVVQRVLT